MIPDDVLMVESPMTDSCAEPKQRHPFEESGLGVKPFHVVGYTFRKGSTCEHCGRSIAHVYVICGNDGRRFEAGSTCVMNTRDIVLQHELKKTRPRAAKEVKNVAEEPVKEVVLW